MLRIWDIQLPTPTYRKVSTALTYRWTSDPLRKTNVYVIAVPPTWPWPQSTISVKGWIQKGEDYAFDGHSVEHFGLDGDYCSSVFTLDGETKMVPNGSMFSVILPPGWYYGLYDDGSLDTAIANLEFSRDGWVYQAVASINTYSGVDRNNYQTYLYVVQYAPGSMIPTSSWRDTLYHEYRSMHNHPEQTIKQFLSGLADAIEQYSFEPHTRFNYTNTARTPVIPPVDISQDRLSVAASHMVKRSSRHNMVRTIATNLAQSQWPAMAKTCCDGQRAYDGNFINWVDKLTSWGGEIESALALAGNLADPKSWASTWLSFRFGSRLEYKTSIDILDAVWDRFLTIRDRSKYYGFNTSRARVTTSTPWGTELKQNMRLVCSSESTTRLMSAVKAAMDWGYWPSLVNTFDLIPFSFVADWLSNVSVVLDNVDDMVYRQYLKVEVCERSLKLKVPITLAGQANPFHATEQVYMTYYHRWGDQKLPSFGILEGYEPSLPSLVNLVDSVSLLVQLRT